jgi:hypothetical protein
MTVIPATFDQGERENIQHIYLLSAQLSTMHTCTFRLHNKSIIVHPKPRFPLPEFVFYRFHNYSYTLFIHFCNKVHG